eukprot:NODE_4517_length_666_cov_384.870704.p4 GENE.NODE_4517_length_666_cov_384.870704~~NODE_4517_length_666_cov_384.870704.p4  ORF type:complete len:65 (-),score=22.87 NODE_4517_length_666_cov_384.870704:399-593(-)
MLSERTELSPETHDAVMQAAAPAEEAATPEADAISEKAAAAATDKAAGMEQPALAPAAMAVAGA